MWSPLFFLKFLSDSRMLKIAMWLIKLTKTVTRPREARPSGEQDQEMDVTSRRLYLQISPFFLLAVLLPESQRNLWPGKKTLRSLHLSRFINNVALRAMVRIIFFKYPGETRENKEATVRETTAEALKQFCALSLFFNKFFKKYWASLIYMAL